MGSFELCYALGGRQLRVVTFEGHRRRQQLWVDAQLVDEVSSKLLPFRYPLLCASVEFDGAAHAIDVVPVGAGKRSGLKILVDGRAVHGDVHTGPESMIDPTVWGRVRERGFWAYAAAEFPKGVLSLAPAVVVLMLFGLDLRPTMLLALLAAVLCFFGAPLLTWARNERRWRSRERLLSQNALPSPLLESAPPEAQTNPAGG